MSDKVTEEFIIDGALGNRVFIGRHVPTDRWNGFANPEFPLTTAITIAGLILEEALRDTGVRGSLRVDLLSKTFEIAYDDGINGPEVEPYEVIEEDSGMFTVAMGHGLCWIEAEFGEES